MRIFILLNLFIIFFLSNVNESNAYTFRTFEPNVPISNGYQNYNNQNGFYNIENNQNNDYPKLTLIENTLFNTSYLNESVYNRLNRIEKKLFRKTFENMDLASRVDNVINNMENGNYYGNISKAQLGKMEMLCFQKMYKKEPIETRIQRLETNVFGTIQSGNLNNRFKNLELAINNQQQQNQYYNNQYGQNNYYPNGYGMNYNGNYHQSLASNFRNIIGNMFNPMRMTGFTPPVYNPFNYYDANYGAQRYMQGTGFRGFQNKNYGTGSSVKVFY